MKNSFTSNKRGPHYVYRLFKGSSTLYVDQGNGARMSRQMCAMNCACEIVGVYRTEEEAFEWAERFRRKNNMRYLGAPIGSFRPADTPLSHVRVRAIVEWYLKYLKSNSPDSLVELQELHKCHTNEALAAKMIADSIVLDL